MAETLTVYRVCEVRSLRGMLVCDLSTSTYNRAEELFLQRVAFVHLSAVYWNSRNKSILTVVPKKSNVFQFAWVQKLETVPMFLKWKKEVCTRAISDTINDNCLWIQRTESFFKSFTLNHCLLSFGNVVLCIFWCYAQESCETHWSLYLFWKWNPWWSECVHMDKLAFMEPKWQHNQ